MIILFVITTVVLYVVFYRVASRGSLGHVVRPQEIPRTTAKSSVKPLTVAGDRAITAGDRAWTALDDRQLDRLLKDSSP
jgi:hypothetical protein